jgi:uncharacterized protein (TIGR02145 family)
MAENLRYKVEDSWGYNSDDGLSFGHSYGRLYKWEAAKTACPAGWHLPGFGEWKELIYYVGGKEVAGRKLKSTSSWNNDESKEKNTADEYNFAALPGGYRTSHRRFQGLGDVGIWWTSTKCQTATAHCLIINCDEDEVHEDDEYKSNGFSVRCVAD